MNEFASPEDTTLAYNKAMEIRQKILSGEDFGTVARTYSDDPSAKDNGGDLGWFTVFRMVYPFETGAYKTPKGEVSMPVRTRFGYHIIKVTDVRPARGEIRVAHIMVMVPESMTQEEKQEAKSKIYSYYDSLQSGMDFTELAKKYSEDRGSAASGGNLPWFGTGRMVPPFEDASFAIENIGDFSPPIQTSFGWHIIKLLDKKTYEDFDSVKADLQSSVTKSDRNTYSKAAMLERIKTKNQFTENQSALADFYRAVDSTIFDGTWDPGKASGLNDMLFSIGDREISQEDFTNYLDAHQGGRKMNLKVFVNRKYDLFVEDQVMQYEEDQLPDKYPEYRHLVQEYHDGILLFDLTDQMVWSKAVKDSAGLEAFYEQHKEDYQWKERMDATLYTCRDAEVAAFAMGLLTGSKRRMPDPDEILSAAIKEFSDSSSISYENRKLEPGDHPLTEQMDWSKDKISKTREENGKTVFLVNNKILKPSVKELADCRGLVTADYQNYLEKEWIQKLREKYRIWVNRELLSKIK
jgi:peptidyl-prolyl cis-trans isomerase SurA